MITNSLAGFNNMVVAEIRAAAALTTSYVAATVIDFQGANTLILEFNFTKGGSTGFRFKIETSNDGTNYYQEQEMSQAGGVTSYLDNEREVAVSDATAMKKVEIPICAKYVKVSAKALTSGTSTSLTITAGKLYI